MNPRIETLIEKKLIGKRLSMSFSDNKTGELWQSFMRRRKEIQNVIGADRYSIQVYNPLYFNGFNPDMKFEKWAAVEVADYNTMPSEMETFILPGGLYAVFNYKGLSTDTAIFHYIFGTWLPGSAYLLVYRPHFEILGCNYKNENPDSEEERWISIKLI